MKKILVSLIGIIMLFGISSCQSSFSRLDITYIDNKYILSNSVIIVDTNELFAKVYDENNQVKMIIISGYDQDYYKRDYLNPNRENPMGYQFIVLPDEVTDFDFIGMYVRDVNYYHIYIISSEGKVYDIECKPYIITTTKVTKIDMQWNLNETLIGNVYSNAGEYYLNGHLDFNYFRNNKEIKVITDEDNSLYLNIDGDSKHLLDDFTIRNFFFNAYAADLGTIFIGNNNEVHHFYYSAETEMITGSSRIFDETIINYGSLNASFDDYKYFYIVTESYVYIYDSNFEEVKKVEIEGNLYGVGGTGSNNRTLWNAYHLCLCYKNDDGTYRIEVIDAVLK